ncbi:hypothetical protein Tco_0023638, partial [Tanacetum coccineum]
KFYPPSRTNKKMKADEDKVSWDQTNKEVKNDNEPSIDKGKDSKQENKIAEILRIETDIFDYESPLCKAFDECNYLFQIDPDVLTKDILGFKTCEDYKDDWIYEWNDKVPWVNEKPWKHDGVWKEPTAVKNRCKPFCFKSGHSEWPTYYKWYEALEDSDIKDEARNKVALEESMNQDEESSNDAWSNYSPIDEWCDQGDATNMEPDVNYNTYLDIS